MPRPKSEHNTGQRRRKVVQAGKMKKVQRGPGKGGGTGGKPTIQGQGNAICRRMARLLDSPADRKAVLEVRKQGLSIRALMGMLVTLNAMTVQAYEAGDIDIVDFLAIQRANLDVGRKLAQLEGQESSVYNSPAVLAIQVNVDTGGAQDSGMGDVLEIG